MKALRSFANSCMDIVMNMLRIVVAMKIIYDKDSMVGWSRCYPDYSKPLEIDEVANLIKADVYNDSAKMEKKDLEEEEEEEYRGNNKIYAYFEVDASN